MDSHKAQLLLTQVSPELHILYINVLDMIIYAARSWKKYLLERNLMMCKTYYTITTEQINDFIYILFIYIKYIYIYIYNLWRNPFKQNKSLNQRLIFLPKRDPPKNVPRRLFQKLHFLGLENTSETGSYFKSTENFWWCQ